MLSAFWNCASESRAHSISRSEIPYIPCIYSRDTDQIFYRIGLRVGLEV